LFVALNLCVCGVSLAQEVPISADGLRRAQLSERGTVSLLDIRTPGEYSSAHIQGALNVPSESLSAWQAPLDQKVVVYCPANCPAGKQAVDTLKARGFQDVQLLDGGYAAWAQKGYPVEAAKPDPALTRKIPSLTPAQARKKTGLLILDVRPAKEYAAGHIPGARNIPLEDLAGKLGELPKEVLVYDRLPARSRKAAELVPGASELKGGLAAWAKMKYALEVK
jgi:rhodanese-related sulfurtransferase